MAFVVDEQHGGQATGADTGDGLQREATIRSRLIDRRCPGVRRRHGKDAKRLVDMTGGTPADANLEPAGRVEEEEVVEGGHAVDAGQREAKSRAT